MLNELRAGAAQVVQASKRAKEALHDESTTHTIWPFPTCERSQGNNTDKLTFRGQRQRESDQLHRILSLFAFAVPRKVGGIDYRSEEGFRHRRDCCGARRRYRPKCKKYLFAVPSLLTATAWWRVPTILPSRLPSTATALRRQRQQSRSVPPPVPHPRHGAGPRRHRAAPETP